MKYWLRTRLSFSHRLALASLALWAATLPAEAHACSCPPVVLKGHYPADGDTEVPTDVVPWIGGGSLELADLRLRDADGNAVSFQLHDLARDPLECSSAQAELIPDQALRPRTSYTIEVLGDPDPVQGGAITFTTGDGPLAAAPPRLDAVSLTILAGNLYGDSCANDYAGCLHVPGAAAGVQQLILELADETGVLVTYSGLGPSLAFTTLQAAPTRATVWARDHAGRRSAPAHIADVTIIESSQDNYGPYEPMCPVEEAGETGETGGPDAGAAEPLVRKDRATSCAATPGERGPTVWLYSATLLLAARRRRR